MSLVILFLKAPVYGQVKTRLAESVGHAMALSLYRLFVETTLERLDPFAPLRIACPPDAPGELMAPWVGHRHELKRQRGGDLGKRMENALADAFSDGHDKAVIMGGDIPDLPVIRISDAFLALEKHDTVFVPVSDGGYCLVGARREARLSAIFEGMQWSHGKVMAETIARARDHGISHTCLAGWHDIDTAEDLLAFVRRTEHSPGFPDLCREAARIIHGAP